VPTTIFIAEVADRVSYSHDEDEERSRHHQVPLPPSGSDATHTLLHSNPGLSIPSNGLPQGLEVGEDSDSVHLQEESSQERDRRMCFTQ